MGTVKLLLLLQMEMTLLETVLEAAQVLLWPRACLHSVSSLRHF